MWKEFFPKIERRTTKRIIKHDEKLLSINGFIFEKYIEFILMTDTWWKCISTKLEKTVSGKYK